MAEQPESGLAGNADAATDQATPSPPPSEPPMVDPQLISYIEKSQDPDGLTR